jgi:hypothetical protein
MRTRNVLVAIVFCVFLTAPPPALAQTQGFQAGMTLGAKGSCAVRTDCGPGFTLGWFANGDRKTDDLPIDVQTELLMGSQGTTERQGFARAALLLRFKSIYAPGDTSPRTHFLVGPQLEFHNTTQLAGIGGRPDLRLALGADWVRRRAIVEFRYTAHLGVRHDNDQTVVIVSRSGAPPPPPSVVSTPRSSLEFRDGAVVLTVGVRVGG